MNDVLFFHGETVDGRRFTIAGKFSKKGRIISKNTLELGVALCGSRDHFIKRIGRIKAEGRIHSSYIKGRMTINITKKEKVEINTFIDYMTPFNNMDSRDLQEKFKLNNQ